MKNFSEVLLMHAKEPELIKEGLQRNEGNIYYHPLIASTLKHLMDIDFSCCTIRSVEQLVKAINQKETSGRSSTAVLYLAGYELASRVKGEGVSYAYLYLKESLVADECIELIDDITRDIT